MNTIAFLSNLNFRQHELLKDTCTMFFPQDELCIKHSKCNRFVMKEELVVVEVSLYSELAFLRWVFSSTSRVIVVVSNPGLLRCVLNDCMCAVLLSPFTREECLNAFTKTMLMTSEKLPGETFARSTAPHKLVGRKNCQMLTARQEELLFAISQGRLYKEVAAQMGISEGTVKQHLHRIYEKLNVSNKIEAIMRMGWQFST